MTSTCPCLSGQSFAMCCEPYLNGQKQAPTAEALMRSRYAAYATGNTEYLKATLTPKKQKDFDPALAKEWAENAEWLGLSVLSVKKGGERDQTGTVEFTVKYKETGKTLELHEVSKFEKDPASKRWFYVDGDAHVHEGGHGHHHHHHPPQEPIVREGPKVGRNDPCPCGSGSKFKKCCGA